MRLLSFFFQAADTSGQAAHQVVAKADQLKQVRAQVLELVQERELVLVQVRELEPAVQVRELETLHLALRSPLRQQWELLHQQ